MYSTEDTCGTLQFINNDGTYGLFESPNCTFQI